MATLGKHEPDGLIAGDFPTEAQEITIADPAEFRRGDVLGIVAGTGRYVLADSSASDGSQGAAGIACDDVAVADGASAVSNMFVKGDFSYGRLRFGGDGSPDPHLRRMTEIGLIVRKTKA